MSEEGKKRGFMSWYFGSNLLMRILIGLILGVVAGLLLKDKILWVQPFGDLFIRLLKMIVVPVILFSLIVGTASISPYRLGKVGIKIIVYYLLTTVFAVVIGLIFANLFKPGLGLELAAGEVAGFELKKPSLVTTFLNIVPTNPVEALSKGDVLPIIFFALLFGIGLSFLLESDNEELRTSAKTVFNFANGAAEAMYKVVRGIMEYAPIGVFALVAVVLAKEGPRVIGPLATAVGAEYLAIVVHVVVVYGLM